MGLLDKFFDKDEEKNRKRTEPARPAGNAPRFDDVRSGSSSTAPSPGAPGARTYTVAAGDSLSKIAQREYGDAGKWRAIYDANRDKISNPDLIHPGQVLTIPPKQ
jgi:nucleoid-associated protein YgaU